MGKYAKLIAFDIAMAVAIVILYSPGLLALRPTDDNFLRAGFSIIFAVVILVALIWVNVETLRTPKYEHLEITGDVITSNLTSILNRYTDRPVIGEYATLAISELQSAERKHDSLYEVLSGKFDRKSLTWQKFAAVVDSATQVVNKNTSLLTNKIQSFDVDEYLQYEKLIHSGAYRNDAISDELQEEKWRIMQNALDDAKGIVEANERLLLELDKFAVELGHLDSSANSNDNNLMIEEVRTLIDETKYYR